VRIDLYKGSVLNSAITSKTSIGSKGTGSYSWNIPCEQLSEEDYVMRIASITNDAYYARSNVFNIKGAGIGVVSPAGGEQWKAGQSRKLQWSYTGCAGSYVKIELLKGGTSCLNISSQTSIGAAGNGSLTWIIPSGLKPGTDYRIRIISTKYPVLKGVSNGNFTVLAR
jgi:hypothetical protein